MTSASARPYPSLVGRRRLVRRSATVLAAVALSSTLAACGSDDDSDPQGVSTCQGAVSASVMKEISDGASARGIGSAPGDEGKNPSSTCSVTGPQGVDTEYGFLTFTVRSGDPAGTSARIVDDSRSKIESRCTSLEDVEPDGWLCRQSDGAFATVADDDLQLDIILKKDSSWKTVTPAQVARWFTSIQDHLADRG